MDLNRLRDVIDWWRSLVNDVFFKKIEKYSCEIATILKNL